MNDVLDDIKQTEVGQGMPNGGILHGKGLTWEAAIELKHQHPFCNLTNEFTPGQGEGMNKHTYAVYTAAHHAARLEGSSSSQNVSQSRQLPLLQMA